MKNTELQSVVTAMSEAGEDQEAFSFVRDVEKPTIGYIQLWPQFSIAAKVKPSEEHLRNMKEQFGWEWRDTL